MGGSMDGGIWGSGRRMRAARPENRGGKRNSEMVVIVNGKEVETAAQVLEDLVSEQSLGDVRIATAVNGQFVAATRRRETPLKPGDRVEIVSPRQGG